MMKELEAWASGHNSSLAEIKILLAAEGHDPDKFLSETGVASGAITGGKETALMALLERGRSGGMTIDKTIIESFAGIRIDSEVISSDKLFGLLPDDNDGAVPDNINFEDDGEPEDDNNIPAEAPASEATPENKINTPMRSAPMKKRTKYSMSKALAAELLKLCGDAQPDIRTARMLFLSLPEYKAQDVAVMSDDEVRAEFIKNYICIGIENGFLILPKQNCNKIKDILGGADNYYIPNA